VPHSKETILNRDEQILAGIGKDLQTMPSLLLGGTTFTPGSLTALIQSRVEAANAVDTAKANWLTAVKTYRALDTEIAPVVHDLRNWVAAAFGPNATQLADFGFAPAPRAPDATPHLVGKRGKRKIASTRR
jgi:hypothetical protein